MDINDLGYLEQSSRQNLFCYDCKTTPLYENQEVYFSAERASCRHIESTTSISFSPDSTTDVTRMTTPIRSASQPSNVDVESAAPGNIPETLPAAACFAPKKRKNVFNQFYENFLILMFRFTKTMELVLLCCVVYIFHQISLVSVCVKICFVVLNLFDIFVGS